jgi:hypothetical protein
MYFTNLLKTIVKYLLPFSLIILAGCIASPNSTIPKSTSISVGYPVLTPTNVNGLVKPIPSFASVYTYKDLVSQAKWIVIGQIVESKETFNGSRQVSDHSKPSTDSYNIAQVYKISVEKYLKGSSDKEIYIAVNEGYLNNVNPNPAEIEKARSKNEVYGIKVNTRYGMFFGSCCNLSGPDIPERNYYGGIIQPWLFEINALDECAVKSPWEFATTYFPRLKLDELVKRIENPDAYTKFEIPAYPAPESNLGEDSKDLKKPYP